MNIKERKALLGKFHKDFLAYTLDQISCRAIDSGVAYGGWFEIVFLKSLDCEDLVLIGKFIRRSFPRRDSTLTCFLRLSLPKKGSPLSSRTAK